MFSLLKKGVTKHSVALQKRIILYLFYILVHIYFPVYNQIFMKELLTPIDTGLHQFIDHFSFLSLSHLKMAK